MGLVLPLVPKGKQYTYIIQDSLQCVVFVTIVVIHSVLPLSMYMQMVQNVCL